MSCERRYPLQPLLDEAGLTRRQLQTELRISWTAVVTLEDEGLTEEQADRYAIRLELWPWQVWPTWEIETDEHPAGEGVAPDRSSCEQP